MKLTQAARTHRSSIASTVLQSNEAEAQSGCFYLLVYLVDISNVQNRERQREEESQEERTTSSSAFGTGNIKHSEN